MNGQSGLKTVCLTQREYTHGIVRYIICTILSITLTQGMLTIVRKCVRHASGMYWLSCNLQGLSVPGLHPVMGERCAAMTSMH